mgnify:FL=1
MDNFIIKNNFTKEDLAKVIQSYYNDNNEYPTISFIVNNYDFYVNNFSAEDYLNIANKILVRYTDNGIIYHPKMTEFAITYGYDKNLLKKWLNYEVPVPGIEYIFKMLLRTGIFIPIVYNIKLSQFFIEFVYNISKRKKYKNLIYIDGDNLQSMAIPIYKEIINASNTKIMGFYVYKIIPSFIDLYTKLNHLEYNESISIISSMNDKKDAADVALNTAHSVIMDRNMQDKINTHNYVVTNDEYSVEIVEQSQQINGNFAESDSFFYRINTISFKPQKKDYLYLDVWYPFNYDFVKLPYGDLVPGLNITEYSYSPWFINLIKLNENIKAIPQYENIFRFIRSSNNFTELYSHINNFFINYTDKLIYFSQYLVIVSMKYFSYHELINYYSNHINYIKGLNVLEGQPLIEFLSMDFNDILKYFYKVKNLEEMLLVNEDLKIIFNINKIDTFANKIIRITFNQ